MPFGGNCQAGTLFELESLNNADDLIYFAPDLGWVEGGVADLPFWSDDKCGPESKAKRFPQNPVQ